MPNTLPVHISCYCDDLELLGGATLVFDTIRVGFPTSKVYCNWMGYSEEAKAVVKVRCESLNITL